MQQVYVKHTCKKLERLDFTFHSLEAFNVSRLEVFEQRALYLGMNKGLNIMLKE